jgi:hypothetical protein
MDADSDADTDADSDADVDTGDPVVYTDADGDGYYAEVDDCDDSRASVNPAGVEDDEVYDNDCDGQPFATTSFITEAFCTVTLVGEQVIAEESAIFIDSVGAESTGLWSATSASGQTVDVSSVYSTTFLPADGTGVSGVYNAFLLMSGSGSALPEDESMDYILDSGVPSATYALLASFRSMTGTDRQVCMGINGVAQDDCALVDADITGTLRVIGYGDAQGGDTISIMSGEVRGDIRVTHVALVEAVVSCP